jgi:molybdenum cofactor cytidylyltransferase
VNTIGIILLAAGSSSRMGRPKQLLPIDGEPLLVRSVKAAVSSKAHELVVVLGSNFQSHREVIAGFPIEVIENQEWQKGMGNSLKKGLIHLKDKNDSLDAVIVLVCDQPYLSSDIINKLIEEFEQTKRKIVASIYAGIIGVPALFDSSMFEKILHLDDEQGAKKLIQQQQLANVKAVEFPKGIIDLDFPEDYESLLGNYTL